MSRGLIGSKNPAWKGGKIGLICLFCNKEYTRFPNDVSRSKYCSISCASKANTKEKIKLKCKECNKDFKEYPSEKHSRKYCSKECYHNHKKGLLKKWTQDDIKLIKKQLAEGMKIKDIADFFNKKEKTITDFMRRVKLSTKMGSKEFSQKCSKRNKELWNNPNHFFHTQEYKDKITAHHNNPKHIVNSFAYRQALSDRATKNKSGLKNFNNGGKRYHGGLRKDLGFYVRSRWEANVARYLKWLTKQKNIKDFKYEPETFDFPIKRGNRSYTPDFKIENIDGSVEYWEIKGYMDNDSKVKIKRFNQFYPNLKLIIFEKEQYSEIKKYSRLIEGWE